ncbi:creatininase family protein [Rothia uropygialis]|uniref:creatininase family protein n=1 Tax=Kocuria sp. 36 TaxID=1415402 RepID=UPI001EE7DA92|nr:creatininase family protein [Kocuria sp. 36]
MPSQHRVHLCDMTSRETAEIDKSRAVVLIPVGAFEQHGPAMPMATDQIRARALCHLVAERLGGSAFVGPELPVGISVHHTTFAGTMTLKPETFIQVVAEYAVSLHRNGWQRVLVVTGHGGNNSALGVVAQRLLDEAPDLEFAWTPITGLAAERIRAFGTAEVTGHCGEAETAQMLHVAPDLVREDLLQPGTTQLEQMQPLPRLSRQARPGLVVTWDRLSANGVLGDPTRATAELGSEIIEIATEVICDYIRTWIGSDHGIDG